MGNKPGSKYFEKIKPGKHGHGGVIPTPSVPLSKSTNELKVVLSFELFDDSAECPSAWQKDEIASLFGTFRKLCERTWQQVIQTGGKASGGKVGLGWTEFKSNDPFIRPIQLSDDIPIAEIRVNDVARLFGGRKDQHFYVIRLDRSHSVCPV